MCVCERERERERERELELVGGGIRMKGLMLVSELNLDKSRLIRSAPF